MLGSLEQFKSVMLYYIVKAQKHCPALVGDTFIPTQCPVSFSYIMSSLEMSSPASPAAPAIEQQKKCRRRTCRPGYKSRSKILRSAKRLQTFLLNKIQNEYNCIKTENIKLKQDLQSSFDKHKEFFNSKHKTIMSQFKVTIDKKYEEYFEELKSENTDLKIHV